MKEGVDVLEMRRVYANLLVKCGEVCGRIRSVIMARTLITVVIGLCML
jgi:hypothetical protein